MFSKILPEACCKMNEHFNFISCIQAYESGETIYGTVVSYDLKSELLTVWLGKDCFAKLPFSEVSIYPLKYSANPEYKLPIQIHSILNKIIAVKILEITSDNKVILSRKNNMLEAFEELRTSSYLHFNVQHISDTEVFGDVGGGISARIPACKLCKSRIRSAHEIVHLGNNLIVKVMSCDYEKKRFSISYKDTFDKYNPNLYYRGEMVTGIVNEVVDEDVSGYFVNISPQVVGIVDNICDMPKLNYGDKIDCVVIKATKKGLRLRFSDFSNKIF